MTDWVVDPEEHRDRLTLVQELREELLARGGETVLRRPGLPPVRVWLDGNQVRMKVVEAQGGAG